MVFYSFQNISTAIFSHDVYNYVGLLLGEDDFKRLVDLSQIMWLVVLKTGI